RKHISIASLGEAIKRQTILINSLSKAYAMTGWRIGYAVGPREIIKAMADLQSQTTSNPTSIAQKAAIAALLGSQESIKRMREEFDRRRRFIVERLKAIPGLRCVEPFGAFYIFPNISAYFGCRFQGRIIRGSVDLAAYLLEEAKVAVVPGLDFGSDAHIRLSYAISIERIAKGLDRMEGALRKLI
ncbi:MAG: aminotransferase class I/II-fold pyridoxal phosphate-dependent enzyme, partial [Candidatus Methylomirabilales bacterium]